jgi:polysaccharide export outer membrane protein
MRRVALLALCLCSLAALAVPGRARAQAADSVYLRPGDLIRLAVYRQPELTGDFAISSEGTIQHPLLSEVSVVGVSRAVIRERLRVALSRYDREPAFVFDFLYRVAVGGEVRLPSLYTLPPQTTVSEALAAAGGVTEYARLNVERLVRNGQMTRLNLRDGDSNAASMPIHSGDQLRVGRGTSLLRDVVGPFAAVLGALGVTITLLRQ